MTKLLLIKFTSTLCLCNVLTACSRPNYYQYYATQHIESYSEFSKGPCGPVFSDPMLPPDMSDRELGCATRENLRATLVHQSDLDGRYKYPLVEGNRGIIPVAKLKSTMPERSGLSSVSAMGGGYDTSAKAPIAQGAQPSGGSGK